MHFCDFGEEFAINPLGSLPEIGLAGDDVDFSYRGRKASLFKGMNSWLSVNPVLEAGGLCGADFFVRNCGENPWRAMPCTFSGIGLGGEHVCDDGIVGRSVEAIREEFHERVVGPFGFGSSVKEFAEEWCSFGLASNCRGGGCDGRVGCAISKICGDYIKRWWCGDEVISIFHGLCVVGLASGVKAADFFGGHLGEDVVDTTGN